jgi:hypothetical protein
LRILSVSVVTALVGRSGHGDMAGLVKLAGLACLGVSLEMLGLLRIEHESLILAQNERWRHA